MKNRLFKLISLSILLSPVLASCGRESFEKQLNDKLLKLDNVRNVYKLDNSNKDFLCQYEVIFN